MTVSPTRPSTPEIPRPRAAEQELPPVAAVATEPVPEPPAARGPWPEPWRTAREARPRTEFWDVTTASWQSRDPAPRPRSED